MSKQYLDYEGLKLYTKEIKKWVLDQIRAQDEKYDDTKVCETFGEFPSVGIKDVMYIDQSTGLQYVWDEDTETYAPLNEAIESDAISDLLNT